MKQGAAEIDEAEARERAPQAAGEPELGAAASAEPEASEPQASEPQASEPQASEPQASEPQASEPEPEASEPEASEAELEAGGGSGDELADEELVQGVAALIFAANEPLSLARLAGLLERPRAARLRQALSELGERLAASGLPIELRAIGGGWQMFTAAEQDELVARLARVKKDERVSPAALETLAVIAYRQPVTKAEIEAIRGVQAGPILRTLVDRGFAKVTGRADVPGHPLLYGTTRKFLDSFGLAGIEDLPRDGELMRD